MSRRGFTLIELLVTMGIIGMLVALLVPTIDRSLNRNNLAGDIDLLSSKIEETRILSGSTQQPDQGVGYYAIYFPTGANNDYFAILRLNSGTADGTLDGGPCSASLAISQAQPSFGGSRDCVVERISLSRNISLNNSGSDKLVVFKSPVQQLYQGDSAGGWHVVAPTFVWASELRLILDNKAATVNLEPYTGKLKVTYSG